MSLCRPVDIALGTGTHREIHLRRPEVVFKSFVSLQVKAPAAVHALTIISRVLTGLSRNIAYLLVLIIQLPYEMSGTLCFGSYCGSHGSALDGRQPCEGASATKRARVGRPGR